MITALRGMKDILDESGELYERVIKTCEKIAKKYGFSYIETPKLEATALFRRSVGESSDIVGKEMYEFSDKSGDSVCLRPEGTAGVVRAFLETKMDRAGAAKKWFYHGSMFRYERPQKGRLREFHQFGVESFGEKSVYEDASIILMVNDILTALNIHTTLKINSLGDSDCMPKYKAKLIQFLNGIKNDLCEDCQRRIATNPIRVLDCKNENCQHCLTPSPLIIDNLNDECKGDFEKLKNLLSANGVSFIIDPKLVRGLDYYCKTAFEFESSEIGAKSAVAGGGRYDGLIEFLGGRATPAVGFALGIERIMEILKSQNIAAKTKIYVCALSQNELNQAFMAAQILRSGDGDSEIHFISEPKSPAKHLAAAAKMGFTHFICIGEDEAKNGEVWYKNLLDKSEKKIKMDHLKDELC